MPEESAFKWFTIRKGPPRKGRKTPVYSIIGDLGVLLGEIKWHGAWRQFCFFPTNDTLWSDGCLADVRSFLKRLRAERRG